MTTSPVPIFVVGMTRSGTKWLCNLLASHEKVAAIQNQRHRGILETSLFDATQRKFNLSRDDDFAAFLELWSHSDFFQAAGASKELFYQLPASSRDYISLFGRLMNDLAQRKGCPFWLQKISPHSALPVLLRFPDARIVITKRRLLDVVRSQAALNVRQGRSPGVAESVYDYAFQQKHIARLRRNFPHAVLVSYEQLKANTETAVERLCDQLKLGPPNQPLRSSFPPNTSFQREKTPLPRFVEFAAWGYSVLLRCLPLSLLISLSKVRNLLRRRKDPESFYSGEFGLLKDALAVGKNREE